MQVQQNPILSFKQGGRMVYALGQAPKSDQSRAFNVLVRVEGESCGLLPLQSMLIPNFPYY